MNLIQKLRQTVEELREPKSPKQADEGWALAGRLLTRVPVDQTEAARVASERDIDGFDALVAGLENPQPKKAATGDVSEQEMEAALRAFKKRLKLARLNDESRLGSRYTTGGKKSQIDAILPPREHAPEVWAALAQAGRLKDTGRGFYALPS